MLRTLVSVPPAFRRFLGSVRDRGLLTRDAPASFIGSDPIGHRLGSGGGTIALLHEAWTATGPQRRPLGDWLTAAPSLVMHGGGESRRLPAYSGIGKSMLPVPILDVGAPHRFDQTLADFQLPLYRQTLQEAGSKACVLVASGDVWLEFDPLRIPPATCDITGIGMRVTPEVACHFGVYFVAKSAADSNTALPIAFFLQKPPPEVTYQHLSRYDFLVDTGLWLLSAEMVRFLFRLSGWDERQQRFTTPNGYPAHLDLYSEIGPNLGRRGQVPQRLGRAGWSDLTVGVIPLDNARFFHVGSSRQLFDSFGHLSLGNGVTKVYRSASPSKKVAVPPRAPVWLDGVATEGSLVLGGFNLVTGLPSTAGELRLASEQCLDVSPVRQIYYAFRPYALDDNLRGLPGTGATICGHDAKDWLVCRGFDLDSTDVFDAPIYPLVAATSITQALLDWFFAAKPDGRITELIQKTQKLSAAEIPNRFNFHRYFADRNVKHAAALLAEFQSCSETGDTRVFAQDFAAILKCCQNGGGQLRDWLQANHSSVLRRVTRPEYRSRFLMFMGELGAPRTQRFSADQAYAELRKAIVFSARRSPARPRLALKEDQIVWGRSPVRLDLAGGWTDTPPYCLEFGGAVVNVAVLLNGQPPIQVFVRPINEPMINLRSIDLGSSEVVRTYDTLGGFRDPRSGFSLPKAALALAGFMPEFSSGKSHGTLRARLKAFGGGLEISLLSAVPKGSGLGTSSVLGATLLGALNRACSLGWDEVNLYHRVLAVEQLLTTGGGWQDQAGALFRGLKLIQTISGPAQTPNVRYLPGHLFDANHANCTLLLYYTGITRLAKGILKEIVHDMFLRRFTTLQTLTLIRQNAHELFAALQRADGGELCRCISRSWDLNKRLDPGTTNPAIERLLRECGDDLIAAKLLGAGGGGYMLLCTRDAAAGNRIRERLEVHPPNSRARFIEFQLADQGLEVTVS